jgi:hypothetical protein
MKKPGDKRQPPPGGGAAGRAQQFEKERQLANANSKQEKKETSAGETQKKTGKKRSVKPK